MLLFELLRKKIIPASLLKNNTAFRVFVTADKRRSTKGSGQEISLFQFIQLILCIAGRAKTIVHILVPKHETVLPLELAATAS